MRDVNGNESRVDAGSSTFLSLTIDNKCLGTGFGPDASGNNRCADYLRDCLSGKDVKSCKAYLEKHDFWENAQAEVENMLPAIAVQTLNAFEFGLEEVWNDQANQRLLQYKSVDNWLENLTKQGLSTTEVENIVRNTKLIGYLRMLVNKVTKNPAILNKEYKGSQLVLSSGNDLDQFKGSRLYKMGVKPRLAPSPVSVSSVDRLGQNIRDANTRLSITLGLPGLYGFSTRYTLSGGSNPVDELQAKVSNQTKHTAYMLTTQYGKLVERLKKYGKDISPGDNQTITKHLESLSKAEEKLYKAMLYTEKYAELLELHGQKDNTSVLTLDHLKQFVDTRNRYFERVTKKQNDLISIIKAVAEAVNKEVPQDQTQMEPIDKKSSDIDFSKILG